MRALIVDDEAPARSRLARLLAAHPGLQVVGHAADAPQALAQVAALSPEVLFLDVQMPGPSGLDLAASLPDPAPMVVFVTAHDRYAIDAFDRAAVDYLLKPVEPERLARAVQRLHEQRTRLHLPPTQLLIPDRGRLHVVPVAEVLWLEAADNYVVVHTADRAPLMRRSLAAVLADLAPGFMRTHRSAAVALAHVQQWRALGGGEGELLLRGGATAPCSRRLRAAVFARLGLAPEAT